MEEHAYESLDMEIIEFFVDDIITSSPGNCSPVNGDCSPEGDDL